ncbi:MAG TPA: hypothetical protein VEC38_11990 [Candidatus Binataceae bacterium]|nr:hypothetical protein [Candidatus Binataceae bacterium]
MSVYHWLRFLRLIHIYAAIVLVGSIVFNTIVLMPALKRIPPAHAAVMGQRVGSGLMWLGGTAIALLGVSGFFRLWLLDDFGNLFSIQALLEPRLRWIATMAGSWLILAITATASAIWYRTVLNAKLPYSVGLRELEARRVALERLSWWQDWLTYVNFSLALLAALGGIMGTF